METIPQLSYASYFHHPLARLLVQWIEQLSGQPELQRLYERHRRDAPDRPFFDSAVDLLRLRVLFDPEKLGQIPQTGPLVIVANHPFGVLDGVVICWLISQRRTDFRVLTNSVLDGAPEVKDYLLPIDFSETEAARQVNLTTRAECLTRLAAGECIIVFPAGGISTAPTPFTPAAIDDVWKPFTARLISRSGAQVTPVFFEGQNSRLFQIASHMSLELRLAMIFREVKRRIGSDMPVHIGQTFAPEDLEKVGKRQQLVNYLRQQTYALAPSEQHMRIAEADRRALARRDQKQPFR